MQRSRRQFLKALVALAGSSALTGLPAAAPFARAAAKPPVVWHGRWGQPYLCLTFDDCFRAKTLQGLEALLNANPAVKVTFFPVGTALNYTTLYDAGLWKRLAGYGHEIGYHGYDHRHPSRQSDIECLIDYDRWLAACRQALGAEPAVRFARPPYGETSDSFLNLCARRGLVPVTWSANRQALARRSTLRGGDIILMHVDDEELAMARAGLALLAQPPPLAAVTLSTLYDLSFAGSDGYQPAAGAPAASPAPLPVVCPAAPQSRVQVGDLAFVSIRYDQLSLRAWPGRQADRLGFLDPGDFFTITGGPACADGWTWWQVETRGKGTGWVAEGGDSVDPYFISPLR
jgi:peptidoglycan/xylan/chitin deacetylase (PgdA/CDA1 family)